MTDEKPKVPAIPIAAVQMVWAFEPIRSDQGTACVILRIAHPVGNFTGLFPIEDWERFAEGAIDAVKGARRLPPKLHIPGVIPPGIQLPQNGEKPRE